MDSVVDSDAVTELLDPLVLLAQARIGTVLHGKWRLDALLGVGGMAAVYAATHRNGTRAAVKLLHAELSNNRQVRARFLREGYLANAVGHDGAVKVLDDDTAEDGSTFLVTELLDGETLDERRVRFGGKLSEDDVLAIVDQLLGVLGAAHAKGVIHRDLKPENVFLTRAGVVKVLDFGIARLRELSTASTATKGGDSMGTPSYMPPEQARGLWEKVDARSDLWAVGATMFHLLSGKLVHEGRTTNELLLSAMTKTPPPLADASPGISPTVAHVVDRALAFEPDKRWPDALAMQEAVRRAYHDRCGAPISTAPPLMLPETVPNRTLPSAPSVLAFRLPTTGRPVETARSRAPQRWSLSHPWLPGLVFGGFVVLAVGIVGVALLMSSRRPTVPAAGPSLSTPAASEATSAPSLREGTAASTSASASAVPLVAATDLPKAQDVPGQQTQAVKEAPSAQQTPTVIAGPPLKPSTAATATTSTATPATKPSCIPPYTFDRKTGDKHFKLECL